MSALLAARQLVHLARKGNSLDDVIDVLTKQVKVISRSFGQFHLESGLNVISPTVTTFVYRFGFEIFSTETM